MQRTDSSESTSTDVSAGIPEQMCSVFHTTASGTWEFQATTELSVTLWAPPLPDERAPRLDRTLPGVHMDFSSGAPCFREEH